MIQFLLRRALWAIPTILLLMLLTFALTRMAPGDPVLFELSSEENLQNQVLTDEIYRRKSKQMGMDMPKFYVSIWPRTYPKEIAICRPSQRPNLIEIAKRTSSVDEASLAIRTYLESPPSAQAAIMQAWKNQRKHGHRLWPSIRWWGIENQFHTWLSNAIRLDFGRSRSDGQQAMTRVSAGLRWTLSINLLSLLIAFGLAIPIGMYRAQWSGSTFDRAAGWLFNLLYAVPVFWLGTILVVFFTTSEYGSWTNIFPAVGIWRSSPGQGFFKLILQNSGQLWIPIITLSTSMMAFISQQMRSSTKEELGKTYAWQLEARGVHPRKILWGHVFRNASFPLITMLAGLIPASIAGSLVMEVICNIPGMGRLMYDSIFGQDWNVVMLVVLMGSILTVVGMVIGDLLYAWADPRTRLERL